MLDLDVSHEAFNAKASAVIDAESDPLAGVRREAVVDVNDVNPFSKTEFNKRVQKDDRVATAGKADAQAPVAGSPGSEKRGNPRRQTT